MTRVRRSTTLMTAVVAGLVLVLAGLTASPATALTARALSLKATPATAYSGVAVTFSGTLTKSPTGSTVQIQRQSGTSWVIAGSTRTTTSGGAYTVKLKPPTTPASYKFRAVAPKTSTLAAAVSATTGVTVTPAPQPPTITTSSLPDADKGIAYSTTLTKTGNAGTWEISAGALPAGISLTSSTGVLSGTPTVGGTANFTVRFTETGSGLAASKALSLFVTPAPAITTTSLPDATRGSAYSVTLTKTGHPGTWSLPEPVDGLTVDASTGVLSGTPAAVGDFGVYPTFTETGTGRSASAALALHVGGTPLAITTTALPDGTQGMSYSVTLATNGGPGTWASLELPDGLALDSDTGVLSGVPAVSGDYGIYLGFTETASGATTTASLALHLEASPVITTTSVPDGTTGTAYSQQLTATGNAGTWAVTLGHLPPGVTLSESGLLSGKPTATGDYGFRVTFTETATGFSDNQNLLLHVSAPNAPVINTTSLPDGTVGTPYAAQLSKTGNAGTWSISYGSLPPGITLSSGGALSGTPTAAGDSLFIVKFTTLTGYNTKVLSIHVEPAPTG